MSTFIHNINSLYYNIAKFNWHIEKWERQYKILAAPEDNQVIVHKDDRLTYVMFRSSARYMLNVIDNNSDIVVLDSLNAKDLYEAVMHYLRYGYYAGDPTYFGGMLRKHMKMPYRQPQRVMSCINPLLVNACYCEQVTYDCITYYRCYYDSDLTIVSYYIVDEVDKTFTVVECGKPLLIVAGIFDNSKHAQELPKEIEALKTSLPSFYPTAVAMYNNGATLKDISVALLNGGN